MKNRSNHSPIFTWLPRWWAVVLVSLLASGGAGCTPVLTASLSVDGRPFVPVTCRSGQTRVFSGIDLVDHAGRRLRLVQQPDGQVETFLFAPGQPLADHLGLCGSMNTTQESSRINNVYNVAGGARLQCRAVGAIEFKHCH